MSAEHFAIDEALYSKQKTLIAQGSLTNSKRPECLIYSSYPIYARSGHKCFIRDIHGKKYIDFICGLGSNLFGYANPQILQKAFEAASSGALLSLPSTIEIDAAEKVKELFPFIDRMKFLKTGSEATHAALKIARAYTGKDLVLSEGYHSWFSNFTQLTPPALGCPPDPNLIALKDIDDIEVDVAAVIVEPIIFDCSRPRIEWLKKLKAKCEAKGALLIFDEVITGLRFQKYSVAHKTGITPDLICLGKAIGGGFPLSIVGGKKDVMECGEYFVSSTFAGDRVALAAGIEAMNLIRSKYNIDDLWAEGQKFLDFFNAYHEKLQIVGYPTRGVFKGDDDLKSMFWQEAVKAGLLFGPSWFFNFHHVREMKAIKKAVDEIFFRISTGQVKPNGKYPQSPFSARARGGNGQASNS